MKLQKTDSILITGAGGFIGGALAAHFLEQGYTKLRLVDIKEKQDWFQLHDEAENMVLDLREKVNAFTACEGMDYVFNLAADMGGMGFIELNKAACMLSVQINTNMLLACKDHSIKRYFYASSACVYNASKQTSSEAIPLKEEDAYPAMPEDGYGWEKLFSERMCRHFMEDYGLETRVARFHNVYGSHGSYEGGREKAPAALSRKVAELVLSGNKDEMEIWGDGSQARSFMEIKDCVKGIIMIMESDILEPINLGSSELVTINQLVDILEEIAGIKVKRNYKLDAPKGVQGRNSDNTKIQEYLGWEPNISLKEGMTDLYQWIHKQLEARYARV